MCAPMALGLIGAGVSAMGQMSAANAAANNAEYSATVEKINARSRRFEGLTESERVAEKYEDLQGQQTAGYAAGGVDTTYGSSLAVFMDTAQAREQDQATNYINAENAAVSHENKAKQYEYEAKSQRQAGKIGAASSFLSGLGGAVKGGGGGFGSTLMIG